MNSSKGFIGLGAVVIINLALQFAFQWYIIVLFGAGNLTDAFFGAMALPQFILMVLSGSLTIVLIPMISKYSGNEFLNEAWSYFQGIGLLFFSIGLLLFFTAHWWVRLLLPGFKGEVLSLALNLSRIQLIGMVFSALLSVVWAIHSAKNNFILIETTSVLANLIALVMLYFIAKRLGIYAAAWVSVIRVILQVFFLMKIMGPYRKPSFNSPSFKEAGKKIRPLIAGNLYYKTDPLVDKYLTSSAISGELTLLNLAQQIYMIGNSILSKVLINTMVPSLAKAHHKEDYVTFNKIFKVRLLISALLGIGALILIFFFGKWVLETIFSVKNFTDKDVSKLWWLLLLLGGYWIGGLVGNVTSSSFYAKGNTVTPTRIGSITFTLYIPIKIFCYYHFGIAGLAISVSIYYVISFIVQLFFLRKHFAIG